MFDPVKKQILLTDWKFRCKLTKGVNLERILHIVLIASKLMKRREIYKDWYPENLDASP